MTLRLKGGPGPSGVSLIDTETGIDILGSIKASELRLVIRAAEMPRLEFAPSVEYDYEVPGAVRCFIGCPETGKRREVAEIVYADGGRVGFPRDFSSASSTESGRHAQREPAPPSAAQAAADPSVLWLLSLLNDPAVRRKLSRLMRDDLARGGPGTVRGAHRLFDYVPIDH